MKIEQKYLDILEQFDVMICDDDGETVELEWYSPAGEDFLFAAEADRFAESIAEYSAYFDKYEHVEMWVCAKYEGSTRGIPSIRELIEDADAIERFLQNLAAALMDARDEGAA